MGQSDRLARGRKSRRAYSKKASRPSPKDKALRARPSGFCRTEKEQDRQKNGGVTPNGGRLRLYLHRTIVWGPSVEVSWRLKPGTNASHPSGQKPGRTAGPRLPGNSLRGRPNSTDLTLGRVETLSPASSPSPELRWEGSTCRLRFRLTRAPVGGGALADCVFSLNRPS